MPGEEVKENHPFKDGRQTVLWEKPGVSGCVFTQVCRGPQCTCASVHVQVDMYNVCM